MDYKPTPGPKPVCNGGPCGAIYKDGQRLEEITCPCGYGYWDNQRKVFVPGVLVREGKVRSRQEYEKHVQKCSRREDGGPVLGQLSTGDWVYVGSKGRSSQSRSLISKPSVDRHKASSVSEPRSKERARNAASYNEPLAQKARDRHGTLSLSDEEDTSDSDASDKSPIDRHQRSDRHNTYGEIERPQSQTVLAIQEPRRRESELQSKSSNRHDPEPQYQPLRPKVTERLSDRSKSRSDPPSKSSRETDLIDRSRKERDRDRHRQ